LARLVLARGARRDLFELSWPLIDAIEGALGLLELDPRAGHPLRGKLRGLYSVRVGAYRILYQLADGGGTVRVAAIRHRSAAFGRAVATIGPARGGTGKALKGALRANRPDGAWADELRELRDGMEPVSDPWRY
jgi:mRNA-degrading endonuclease RelE of RelBE toxin-antitoxin system